MNIERVQKCLKLLFPNGYIWADKANGGDLETTLNGYAWEFKRVLDTAESISKFFLPYATAFFQELEFMFALPPENISTVDRQGRIDGRFRMLFAPKGRLALYETVLHSAGFSGAVVRTLGSYGTAESPFDFFTGTGFAFYGNEEAIFGDEESIFNNTGTPVGDAYLLTNGRSAHYFEDPENAFVSLEQNSNYWPSYLVVEGPSNTKLSVPMSNRETFFDSVYGWKPADMHVILNIEFA